ncbi:MAG: hypothetical protein JNJ83_24265 [Verrucomicrobiaceae bacterium]|nr:hypothetical protein [Verrucomicrobiaceae bacterium]
MSLTPQQIALAEDPSRDPENPNRSADEEIYFDEPLYECDRIGVHFKEPLGDDDWRELTKIVKARLEAKYEKRMVVEGLFFRAGGLVWWDRTRPPCLSPSARVLKAPLYFDGSTYSPDVMLHRASMPILGVSASDHEVRWRNLRTRIEDLRDLAAVYYDVKVTPEEFATLQKIAETGEGLDKASEIFARMSRPDNHRATVEAEELSLGCSDLIKVLNREDFRLTDVLWIANLAFKVGAGSVALQQLRDKRLLEQNKNAKLLAGAGKGGIRETIEHHCKQYLEKHGRFPLPNELLETGSFMSETKHNKVFRVMVDETWISIGTFRDHVGNIARDKGEKRGRGRPRKQ